MLRSILSKIGQLVPVLLLVCVLFTSACDECQVGNTHCEGTHVIGCEWQGDGLLSKQVRTDQSCDVACVPVSQANAVCAVSTEPIPECDHVSVTCWNGGVAHCVVGFPTDWTACDQFHSCVTASCPEPSALCATNATPDPACNGGDADYCGGRALMQCQCGFTIGGVDCGGEDLCRNVDGTDTCTISSTPDPRCGTSPAGLSGFCDGNTGITCWQGIPVSSIGCGTGTCTITDKGAACALMATVDPNG
jgi:hypothetical protein